MPYAQKRKKLLRKISGKVEKSGQGSPQIEGRCPCGVDIDEKKG